MKEVSTTQRIIQGYEKRQFPVPHKQYKKQKVTKVNKTIFLIVITFWVNRK